MSSVEVGDWMVAKTDPGKYLEVVATSVEDGVEHVTVRVGRTELQVSKRYLLANWQHLEES